MHRKYLLEKLKAFEPNSVQDLAVVEKFRHFVVNNEKCFERSLESGHVTGSAWLVDPSGERVLLTHHKKLNKWMQLGGHSDGEANSLDVAIKEAREESGIEDIEPLSQEIFDIDIHKIPATASEPEHYHYDVRYILQARHDQFEVSDESHDLRWVHFDEMESMELEPSVMKMAKRWRQAKRI